MPNTDTAAIPAWFRNIVADKLREIIAEDAAADIERPGHESLAEAVRRADADVQAICQEMLDNPAPFANAIAAAVHTDLSREYYGGGQ